MGSLGMESHYPKQVSSPAFSTLKFSCPPRYRRSEFYVDDHFAEQQTSINSVGAPVRRQATQSRLVQKLVMKPALPVSTAVLTAEERERAVAIFNKLDVDGNGVLEPEECFAMRDQDRTDLYKHDVNSDGLISPDEWILFLTSRKERIEDGAGSMDMDDFFEALEAGAERCSERRAARNSTANTAPMRFQRASVRKVEPRRALINQAIAQEPIMVCRMLGDVNGRENFSTSRS